MMKRIFHSFVLAVMFVFLGATSALAVDVPFHDENTAGWKDFVDAGIAIERVQGTDFLQPGLTYDLTVLTGICNAGNSLAYDGVTFYTHLVSSSPTTYENVELEKLIMKMAANKPFEFDFANEDIYYTGDIDINLHSVLDTTTAVNRVVVFSLLEDSNINGIDFAQGSLIFFIEIYNAQWDTDYNDLVLVLSPSSVPVPAAALLLGSGLAGLAALRKKF